MSALVHTPGGARQLVLVVSVDLDRTQCTDIPVLLGKLPRLHRGETLLDCGPGRQRVRYFDHDSNVSNRNVLSNKSGRVRQGRARIYALAKEPQLP